MRITPEIIRYFAQSVRVNLQTADVQPRNVLLRRVTLSKRLLPSSRRFLTVENSPSQTLRAETVCVSESTTTSFPGASRWAVDSTEGLPGSKTAQENVPSHSAEPLPQSCPGCGALSQEIEVGEAGYYSRSRRAVRNYLRSMRRPDEVNNASESQVGSRSSQEIVTDREEAGTHGGEVTLPTGEEALSSHTLAQAAPLPVCDRCHELIYQSRGVSIAHPPIDAIADSIAESPFRHNHVFHVLDAADFPLSLIPNIHKSLSLAKPRSQNRRSQHDFSRKPTLSFVITRGDLVSRTKEGIDHLMPYFTSVLRTALGSLAQDIRLGNVHLVSAKRGWWTRGIKESIWRRGGGNWMVGKANVGKSNLFEVLFPKGSGERAPSYTELQQGIHQTVEPFSAFQGGTVLPESSLLPTFAAGNAISCVASSVELTGNYSFSDTSILWQSQRRTH